MYRVREVQHTNGIGFNFKILRWSICSKWQIGQSCSRFLTGEMHCLPCLQLRNRIHLERHLETKKRKGEQGSEGRQIAHSHNIYSTQSNPDPAT